MQRRSPARTAVSTVRAEYTLWSFRPPADSGADAFFKRKDVVEAVRDRILASFQTTPQVWVGRELRVRVGQYSLTARLDDIDPYDANLADPRPSGQGTRVDVNPREAKPGEMPTASFLAETIRYPNPDAEAVLGSLVGLDQISEDLYRKLALLIRPGYIEAWAQSQYGNRQLDPLLQVLRTRYPLIVLEGDVGSGKTALARSIGNRVATTFGEPIALFVMNAQVRGSGRVGEMTQNISRAFEEAERCEANEQIGTLLLIDEADALAQARGSEKTHHEDDAAVNTLIQRIDRVRTKRMAVLLATNLAHSLDSAILRRAVASYRFTRPSREQRGQLFERTLAGTFNPTDIAQLVQATDPRVLPDFGDRAHRYTYSDITQRILPAAVEAAIFAQPQFPLSLDVLLWACRETPPTPELRFGGP